MKEYNLNNNWNLWYHSLEESNWGKGSYKKLITLRNLLDYKLITDGFEQNHYQNGMFFLMKEDIFPNWEDPHNRLGGCLSFKIASSNLINSWNTLFLQCICGNIFDQENDKINGISISPKKEFNIIKIWLREEIDYKSYFNKINIYYDISNSIYRKHKF
jgi:hypothetical protein